jgi:UDP-N-acetylmuramyl-tripeptide synthetase
MKLKQLLGEFGIYTKINREVTGITLDSRQVKDGFVFVAYKGCHHDGYNFIEDAVEKGAICVISDRDFKHHSDNEYEKVIVKDVYEFSAKIALYFYDYPSKKINLIGITGTNGKTTTTYILESIYREAGHKTGIIGTIQNKINDEILKTENTTPFPVDLQKLLNQMVSQNVDTVFMEVSSHALTLDRVVGCEFDGAIFSNLTKEHLDFHINMKNYCMAKQKLFNALTEKGFAVVNLDDKYSKKMIEKTKAKVLEYSLKEKTDVYAKNIKFDRKNFFMNFDIIFDKKNIVSIKSHLLGKHNVYNILSASAMAYSQGIDIQIIKRGIEKLTNVLGRFEFVREGQDFACVVDYAHTDDALTRILKACKSFRMNRIITVFGCGGNRDRKKRPLMAKAAAKYSDFVIVTSDNPREEDPRKIITDIEIGFNTIDFKDYTIIIDRDSAIEEAIKKAQRNDLVLIAGKGHENYQIIGTQKIDFSDKEVAANKIVDILNETKENFLF